MWQKNCTYINKLFLLETVDVTNHQRYLIVLSEKTAFQYELSW